MMSAIALRSVTFKPRNSSYDVKNHSSDRLHLELVLERHLPIISKRELEQTLNSLKKQTR